MRTLSPYVLLILAGGISALGFAPLNLWPLSFLAVALLMDYVVRAPRLHDVLMRGWSFGVGHFIVGLNWIATAFTYQANMPAWYGWIAVVLLSLYLALFPAIAGAFAWRLFRHHKLAFIFVFAAAWMLCEWLRGTLLTGFAWNPTGAVWLALPWVAQSARWVGAYGLSALVILTAGLFWFGLQRGRLTTVGVSLTLTMLFLLLGRSMDARPEPYSAFTIPFRIVQPNIGQNEKNDPARDEQNARQYASLSSGKPSPAPRLLFWPEAATLRFLELEPKARADLAALLGPRDILITGGASVTLDSRGGSDDVYRNSVFALDSAGVLLWRYDKAHLVPFGEYLPARPILARMGVSRLVPGDGDFTPGPGPRTFPLPGFGFSGAPASIGVQICYEIIFPGRVINAARRPSFLFNPSNDAWFGAWGPPQHLAQAQLRAIEEGLPVIRATPNGISALIGPTGRVIATVARHRAGVIDGFIPQPLPPTVFSRVGLWACALFGFCLCAIAVVSSLFGKRMQRAAASFRGSPFRRPAPGINVH